MTGLIFAMLALVALGITLGRMNAKWEANDVARNQAQFDETYVLEEREQS